jgi:hypothetical protein
MVSRPLQGVVNPQQIHESKARYTLAFGLANRHKAFWDDLAQL